MREVSTNSWLVHTSRISFREEAGGHLLSLKKLILAAPWLYTSILAVYIRVSIDRS